MMKPAGTYTFCLVAGIWLPLLVLVGVGLATVGSLHEAWMCRKFERLDAFTLAQYACVPAVGAIGAAVLMLT